ncbi:MAG: aminoacetone oxidase family FAD-binding enzyme [Bacilli bacterium]|nr:aminoacetone oxidase family FAD-binding enzyme [Bacilli bacterium]
MKKVFIIGGGASGLTAAIKASKNGNDVTIFEKNNKLGKKILITGNGKCNYWNENQDLSNYHSSGDYTKIVNQMNLVKAHTFLDSIGLVPYIKNGYYYPSSQQAISVVNALVDEVKNNGVKIINEEVTDVKKKDNKFIINNNYESDVLIIATGGMAASKTGSDGFGYKIAQQFNHNIIKPLPALVGLKTEENLKDLSGVRFIGEIKLLINNEEVESELGEIQINEYGFSGIPVMQISSKAIKALDENKNVFISINFLPNIASDILGLRSFIKVQSKHLNNKTITQILDQLFNYKLSNYFLDKSNIDPKSKVEDLTNDELDLLCHYILNNNYKITDDNGFENAQVTSGGIDLKEIDAETLESLKEKNLYFCGEILDVDGACGGYNLSFAWISGLLAGNIK